MATFTATPVSIASTRSNGNTNPTRETREQREARAKSIFASKQITYLGILQKEAREHLAKGGEVELLGNVISAAKPGVATCSICHLSHDLKQVHLSVKVTFYQNEKTKQVFSLSDSCREIYLGGQVQLLTNPEKYRGDFPKVAAK